MRARKYMPMSGRVAPSQKLFNANLFKHIGTRAKGKWYLIL